MWQIESNWLKSKVVKKLCTFYRASCGALKMLFLLRSLYHIQTPPHTHTYMLKVTWVHFSRKVFPWKCCKITQIFAGSMFYYTTIVCVPWILKIIAYFCHPNSTQTRLPYVSMAIKYTFSYMKEKKKNQKLYEKTRTPTVPVFMTGKDYYHGMKWMWH